MAIFYSSLHNQNYCPLLHLLNMMHPLYIVVDKNPGVPDQIYQLVNIGRQMSK